MLMQDRMTPVFNKMFTAMQRTLDVMEGLNDVSKSTMKDTSGFKLAQQAINAARNDIVKLQKDLDMLDNKNVGIAVNVQRDRAQKLSGFTRENTGAPVAQMAMTPPTYTLSQMSTPQKVFAPVTKEAEEANAAALKVQRSINGIRAPNNLVSTFSQAGSAGSNAGRIMSAAMAQARENATKVNVEGLRISKAFANINYQATALKGNSFGAQMKAQLDRVNEEANELNDNLRETQSLSSGAGNSMKLLNLTAGIALARQAWDAVKGSSAYMDNLSSIQARLNNINDGTQTTTELQSKIIAAANRSRGSYQDMADSVAKLNLLAGDAFKSNDEAIAFTEQLNKMFVVSGTSAQEASAAMYQLNQAMASGRLQGDEFRSIIENAPMLANAIAKSMGVSRAKLKEMSSEGAITANVIKRAMADCADEVNSKFKEMPMTFSQSMNLLKNKAASKMQAVADAFSGMINSGDIQIIADTFGTVITVAARAAIGAIKALSAAFSFLKNNMNWIAPIATSLAIAFGTYTAVLIAHKVATGVAAAAQLVLNSAMWACPVTWIVLGFVALVAIIYAVVGAVNAFFGTSYSALGIIAGAVCALGAIIFNIAAFVYNIVVFVVTGITNFCLIAGAAIAAAWDYVWKFVANLAISAAEWVVNKWNAAVYTVTAFFAGLGIAGNKMAKGIAENAGKAASGVANFFIKGANKAVDGINWIIDALNKIPGVDISKATKFGEVDWKPDTSGFDENIKEFQAMIDKGPTQVKFDRFEYDGFQMPELLEPDYLDFKDIGEAYDTGYKWGEGVEKDIGDFFSGDNLGIPDDLTKNVKNISDLLGKGQNKDVKKVGKVNKVGKIDSSVELSDEDVKMLKDIATTKYVNKFTTLQPNMTVQFGDVHETADLDELMEAIENMTEQALSETVLEEEG